MSSETCPACRHEHSGDCATCAWRVADAYKLALQKIAVTATKGTAKIWPTEALKACADFARKALKENRE